MSVKMAVTPEGVGALCKLADSLQSSMDTQRGESDLLDELFAQNQAGLGPHADAIKAVIGMIQEELEAAGVSARILIGQIRELATSYLAIIGHDGYGEAGSVLLQSFPTLPGQNRSGQIIQAEKAALLDMKGRLIELDAAFRPEGGFTYDGLLDSRGVTTLVQGAGLASPSAWKGLSIDERAGFADGLAGRTAERLGLDHPPAIQWEEGESHYDPNSHSILIDDTVLADLDDTSVSVGMLVWEAYQYRRGLNPSRPKDAYYRQGWDSSKREGQEWASIVRQIMREEARSFGELFRRGYPLSRGARRR